MKRVTQATGSAPLSDFLEIVKAAILRSASVNRAIKMRNMPNQGEIDEYALLKFFYP